MRVTRSAIAITTGLYLFGAVCSAQSLPSNQNSNLRYFGYYFSDGRYGDYTADVFPYTNMYVATPDGYNTGDPDWQDPLRDSLQHAVDQGKAIYLLMMQKQSGAQSITFSGVLDTAAPYWNNVVYVEVAQTTSQRLRIPRRRWRRGLI